MSEPVGGEPLDPRVAELLSALLDGAVTAEERAVAEQWLERSPAARAEYRALHAVKAAVAGLAALGSVEPPFGFYERMLGQGTPTPTVGPAIEATSRSRPRRARRRFGAAVASVAASAAAFVVVGGASAPDRIITPSVADVAAGDAAGTTTLRGTTAGVRVLRQEADGVDWDDLPRGQRLDRGGFEIWRDLTTDEGEERVVVHRDGVVVTVTSAAVEADDLIALGREVIRDQPAADDDGMVDRARRACENLLRSLSVGS